jgi:cholesterol oxidase
MSMTSEISPANSSINRRKFLQFSALAGSYAAMQGPEALAFQAPPKKFPDETREIVVIGSGFGGAISALRLVQAGKAVTIIEQGRRWDQPLPRGTQRFSRNLYPDGRSTWLSPTTVIPLGPRLPIRKTIGVLQGRKLAGKMVLNGAAWGGGSITWGGVMVKPEKHIFERVFPKEISFEELQPHYDEVGRRLNRSTLPADVRDADCYQHLRVAEAHNEKAGIRSEDVATSTDWDIVRQELRGEIPASLTAGEAVYGVNSGAKGGMDRSYLKEAEETGLLEIKTLHRVSSIGRTADGLYRVALEELNEDGDVIALRGILCRKLFLTAGSVSTTSLLVKAKAQGTLPALNDDVGQGWGNNGNAYALRLGIPESTGRVQGGPPSLGLNVLDHPLTPVFIEHPQFPLGIDLRALMYFSIGLTPTRGRFRYVPEKDEVVIDWPKNDEGQELVNEVLLDTLKKLNKANGGWTSSVLTYLREQVKDDICYHPLGGCVIGKACDFYGRVKGYEGLYVNDGALMPGASGCCNPSFTISALAERNIAEIVAQDFQV